MRHRLVISCCALAAAAGVVAPPAAARSVDLARLHEPRLVANQDGAFMNSVASAGDVNADGFPDVIVAGSGLVNAGVVRVFFGPLPNRADLDESPERGFSIYGAGPDDYADFAAAAGDVNGDSLDDVVVVASGIESRAYVVFGKTSEEDVELAEFDDGTQGTAGFRIEGSFRRFAGTTGDTDGDHLSDVFVGGYDRVYLVRGKTDTLPVDVTTFHLGAGDGYQILHPRPRRDAWSDGAYAGDANGDGFGDLAVSAGRTSWQTVWVVFGKEDNSDVEVGALGDAGYTIEGPVGLGDLSTAGDVNGDHLDDLVIGDHDENRAYVVFGRADATTIPLRNLGRRGFRVFGPPPRTERSPSPGAGRFVAGGVDMDADGLSDFVVAAPWAGHRGRVESGSAYLVYGKRGTKPVRLGRLGKRGIRFDGEDAGDHLGTRPAMPGDVTNDGSPDVLLGEYGRRAAGGVHVIPYHLLLRR